MLACTAISKSDRRPPLALSRPTFEAISSRWKLPRSLLYLLSTRRTCFFPFEDIGEGFSGHSFQTVDKNGRPFTCALSSPSNSHQTNIFLYGPLSEDFTLICSELESSPHLATLATFVPICLLDLTTEDVEYDLQRCLTRMHDIKLKLGMAKSASDDTLYTEGVKQFDFVPVMRELTALGANLAKCELACDAHLLLLDQLDEVNNSAISEPNEEKWVAKDVKTLQRRIQELRGWMQALRPRTKYLTKRSQAYVQTVYSLMAQKDNALNMQTSEASLRISEASYRDSAAMIALAEDSKQVALATSRDSSSMFIISALTLIYLPSTFTASLFGTEFFDFTSANGNGIMTRRFWLYWAVTIPLTVVTAACAAYFWRMRDAKLTETFVRRGTELAKIEKGLKEKTKPAKRGEE